MSDLELALGLTPNKDKDDNVLSSAVRRLYEAGLKVREDPRQS